MSEQNERQELHEDLTNRAYAGTYLAACATDSIEAFIVGLKDVVKFYAPDWLEQQAPAGRPRVTRDQIEKIVASSVQIATDAMMKLLEG